MVQGLEVSGLACGLDDYNFCALRLLGFGVRDVRGYRLRLEIFCFFFWGGGCGLGSKLIGFDASARQRLLPLLGRSLNATTSVSYDSSEAYTISWRKITISTQVSGVGETWAATYQHGSWRSRQMSTTYV